MCMAIRQNTVGLFHSVDSRSGHVVSAAKVAGRMDDNSVRNGCGCCGKNSRTRVSTICPAQHSLKGVVERKSGGDFWKNKEAVNEY